MEPINSRFSVAPQDGGVVVLAGVDVAGHAQQLNVGQGGPEVTGMNYKMGILFLPILELNWLHKKFFCVGVR